MMDAYNEMLETDRMLDDLFERRITIAKSTGKTNIKTTSMGVTLEVVVPAMERSADKPAPVAVEAASGF